MAKKGNLLRKKSYGQDFSACLLAEVSRFLLYKEAACCSCVNKAWKQETKTSLVSAFRWPALKYVRKRDRLCCCHTLLDCGTDHQWTEDAKMLRVPCEKNHNNNDENVVNATLFQMTPTGCIELGQ